MQLKKLSLAIISTSCVMTPVLNAASSDEVKFSQMKYEENKDRMKVDFTSIDIKKDFGTDYTLNVNLSYDTLSGGTPVWDSKSGASAKETLVSNDPRCSTPNLCKDLNSNDQLLSDGQANMNDFVYKNAQIDDTRKAVSASLIKRDEKRNEFTTGVAYSKEEDFDSKELSFSYMHYLNEFKNDSIIAGLSIQQNDVLHRRDNSTWKDFNAYNFQIGYTKIFTKNFLAQANFFASKQSGELSNPYQTIIRYFDISNSKFDPVYNYFIAKEKRPDERISQGISLDSAYKYSKNLSLHNAYRFYMDDWGINSHTFTINSYYGLTPKFTLTSLLRYYTQSAADFYKAHDSSNFHFDENSYGTADERMGSYHGTTYSLGLEYKPKKNLDFNIMLAKQNQSFGLKMNWFSLGLKYRF